MMLVGALSSLASIIIIVLAVYYLGPKTKFGYDNFTCPDIMAAVHKDSFSTMNECQGLGKYNMTAKSFNEMTAMNNTCAYTDRARYIWET
jgi:hypothetical protein